MRSYDCDETSGFVGWVIGMFTIWPLSLITRNRTVGLESHVGYGYGSASIE